MTIPYRSKVGWFDYNDAGATQSHTGSGGFLKIENDGLGIYTQKDYKPLGMTDIWNSSTNQFDFSELSVGDMVDIRFDLVLTTNSNNQLVEGALYLAIGSANPYTLGFGSKTVKSSSTAELILNSNFYIGSEDTRSFPAEFRLNSDAILTIDVEGWYIKITRR